MLPQYQNIHFVGIGGIGMSGIAEVLLNLGYRITGSDQRRSSTTTRLRKKGAKIFYHHKSSNVDGAHVVVISSAVRETNPEVVAAHKQNIPVIPRAEMLAELMRMKYGLAVAGSHGKTTATSLVGQILQTAKLDPTLVIGGRLNSLRSNAKLGKGAYLVAEADESDGSFLKLTPTLAMITNIDPEHMEHYKDFETLKASFMEFANKVPFYGSIIACTDHPTIRELLPRFRRKTMTYALKDAADYTAKKIEAKGLHQSFEVWFRNKRLGKINFPMAGRHNVSNALGAIAMARELDIPFKIITQALKNFRGIQRRLQVLYDGEITVLDDYGHHPVEIEATLSALKTAFPKRRIVVIFQPHRYSRTRDLFNEFTQAFHAANQVYLTEIYPAGEKPIVGISGTSLSKALQHEAVQFFSDRKKLIEHVQKQSKKGDVILTLGAGDITQVGQQIAKQFKNS